MKRIALWVASFLALGAWAEADHVVLDYVEATGSQWVDTGIVGRYGTKAEIQAEWTGLGEDTTLLACRGAADTDTRINCANEGYASTVGYGYGFYVRTRILWTDQGKNFESERRWELDRIYSISTEFAKTGDDETTIRMTVDGVKMMKDEIRKTEDAVTNALVDAGCNLTVFGNNIAGRVTGLARARIYGLKIWQDGELKRDFTPVLKDGRAGFRDAVTGGFFFSASGTELVAGPDASEPDAYVEYVESDGVAFVDLDVVGRSGLTLESRMSWTEVPGDGSYVASRRGDNPRFYMYHYFQQNTVGYNNFYNTGAPAQAGVVYDVRSVLKSGEQKLTVNGMDQISRTDGASVDTGLNLYLFACNKDGAAVYKTKARCYSLKLYDGETLVRDLVPCVKHRRPALLDRVSGRFFFAGAGRLVAGRNATSGRPDYFVEYLESKGDTWLDTGVRARNDVRATGEFALTLNPARAIDTERYVYFGDSLGHAERTLLGACARDAAKRFYLVHMPNGQLWMGYDETRLYPSAPGTGNRIDLGTSRHAFDVTLAQGSQTVVLDGATVHQGADANTVDAGGNLYLFACNKGGLPGYFSNARVYGLKLWQDGEPVRDFRPCMKDGVAGFYDAVNDEVVYPALPIRPDCIGAPLYTDDLKPEKTLAYVETDGKTWIDTGVTGRSGTVAEFDMAWLEVKVDVGLLGARGQNDTDSRFYMWHNAWAAFSYGYGTFRYPHKDNPAQSASGGASPETIPIEVGRVYHVKSAFLPGSLKIEVDGRTVVDRVDAALDLDTGRSMYLFGYNIAGTLGCVSKVRLSTLKIWQDGMLVRSFVPVLVTGGLPALYDKVGKKIYAPQGATFSVLGPVTGEYRANSETLVIVR